MLNSKIIGAAGLAMCLLHIASFLYFLLFSQLFSTNLLLIELYSLFVLDVFIIFGAVLD